MILPLPSRVHRRKVRLLGFLLLLAALLMETTPLSAAQQAPQAETVEQLLLPAPVAPLTLTAAPSLGTRRSRPVLLNQALLSRRLRASRGVPGSLALNLFNDAVYAIVIDRIEETPGRSTIVHGHVAGMSDSQFLLASEAGAIAASLFLPGRGNYKVSPIENGLHQVAEIDTEVGPACAVGSLQSQTVPQLQIDQSIPASRSSATPTLPLNVARGGPTLAAGPRGATDSTLTAIELMVVYTDPARSAAGGTSGIDTLIDLAVAEANACYANSLINDPRGSASDRVAPIPGIRYPSATREMTHAVFQHARPKSGTSIQRDPHR